LGGLHETATSPTLHTVQGLARTSCQRSRKSIFWAHEGLPPGSDATEDGESTELEGDGARAPVEVVQLRKFQGTLRGSKGKILACRREPSKRGGKQMLRPAHQRGETLLSKFSYNKKEIYIFKFVANKAVVRKLLKYRVRGGSQTETKKNIAPRIR